MRSWLPRRRERLERVEAEADALILDLAATAYSQARRREHEASSDLIFMASRRGEGLTDAV